MSATVGLLVLAVAMADAPLSTQACVARAQTDEAIAQKKKQRRRDKAKNEHIQKGRGAVARKPRHLKEIQDLKEAMARLEAQLLECRREKEASTVNRHSFSQQIQGVGLQQPEGLNQPVDNTEPLQEAFTPEQAVLVQRQLAERDQLHQQAMQELIDSRHVQLQQVARDTKQVCSAEKRSLEDLLKSKDVQLKQESRKKQRTHQPRPRQQTSSPKNCTNGLPRLWERSMGWECTKKRSIALNQSKM